MRKFMFILLVVLITILGVMYLHENGGLLHRITPIATLKANPEQYQTAGSATIKGTILATTDIFGFSAAKISDESGRIYILSPKGYREGDQVMVSGHIENVLGKGSLKFLVFVEDVRMADS